MPLKMVADTPKELASTARWVSRRDTAIPLTKMLSTGAVLWPGSTSQPDQVRALRGLLLSYGFVGARVSKDSGVYDDKLKALVIAFQRSRGLEVDGVVGKETVDALVRGLPPTPAFLDKMSKAAKRSGAFGHVTTKA